VTGPLVTVGTGPGGRPVVVDLDATPHGVIVGATGSGKTELVRSMVSGLAAAYGPDTVTVALTDYLGTATYRPLEKLPHVAAVMTDLAEDLSLLDRFRHVLMGELERRRALAAPGPRLLVVCDDVGELLTADPGVLEVFERIGRAGHPLGVHLLLAAQRLEEGRLRGLDRHLSYRIALRTFSRRESTALIGVPDAAELPPEPGAGYLRRSCTIEPFRSALAGAPAPRSGPPARRIWLAPLTPSTMDSSLLTDARPLRVPVAVLDRPFEHRQEPMWLDLSGPPGNLVVVGDTGSGKTTLLRTVVGAFARTHPPRHVRFHLLDGGDGLSPLRDLPHVTGDGDAPGTIAHLHGLLYHRRDAFRRRGIAHYGQVRRRPDRDRTDEYGDVFLVVDGHPLPDDPMVADLARQGPPHGIHLVVTSPTYAEVPDALQPFHAVVVELRLRDPATSRAGRRLAGRSRSHGPGRGLTPEGLHFQTTLPTPTR
jgi:S-DNA-T family DNA segregation ATPase FtsK/SpoIIIE